MNDELPPGWYTDNEGQERYWTGSEWLTRATGSPKESPVATQLQRRPKKRLLFAVIALVITVVASGEALSHHREKQETERQAAMAAARSAEAVAEAEAKEVKEEAEKARQKAKERLDKKRTAEEESKRKRLREEEIANIEKSLEENHSSWEPIQRGSLYYRYLDSAEYECGYFPCFGVAVFSVEGCTNGVFIEASILDQDVVVDYTNGRIGHLNKYETGIHIFDLVGNYNFDSHRIDSIVCN